jgi:hypothetical protein
MLGTQLQKTLIHRCTRECPGTARHPITKKPKVMKQKTKNHAIMFKESIPTLQSLGKKRKRLKEVKANSTIQSKKLKHQTQIRLQFGTEGVYIYMVTTLHLLFKRREHGSDYGTDSYERKKLSSAKGR